MVVVPLRVLSDALTMPRGSSGYCASGSEEDRVYRFLPDVAIEPYLQTRSLSAPGIKSLELYECFGCQSSGDPYR